ncbi:type II secretion system GspH family protein [Undibacterium sp. Jales W-56]|uniref:type II secretion system protein n=1 Tax=Undibacterium sp. Jales W-56 TaxID=2897325 RepID=UPI0021D1A92B|nr:prepilin-type N-terminal cleavage/methylation domain-containing protein [Undibacterium sp. Jales W-56]MCU6432696.1 type II secretion system GspH family protein [Undibacterium sp. Jales W-56]
MRNRRRLSHSLNSPRQKGFTLAEAIIVMTITGILAAGVAVFIQKPVQGYFDLARRTELSDIADTSVRRISRDLHLALPNSVRTVASDTSCLEFLPTKTGGRYRADVPGNVVDTAVATSIVETIGPLSAAPVAGDRLVIYNLGIPGADAYNSDNSGVVASSAGSATSTQITLSPAKLFPFTSPASRFHVISGTEQAVFYACKLTGIDAAGNGQGRLYRFSGYGINPTVSVCPTVTATTPVLAENVSSCSFAFTSGVTSRTGLVSIRLGITKSNETVTLYHDVHVSNVP